MSETPAVVLDGVHKSFGKHEVLKGIDLELAPHEVVCVIGASGSGKSTLLRCVNLLEPIERDASCSAATRSPPLASTSTGSAAASGSSSSSSTCSRT